MKSKVQVNDSSLLSVQEGVRMFAKAHMSSTIWNGSMAGHCMVADWCRLSSWSWQLRTFKCRRKRPPVSVKTLSIKQSLSLPVLFDLHYPNTHLVVASPSFLMMIELHISAAVSPHVALCPLLFIQCCTEVPWCCQLHWGCSFHSEELYNLKREKKKHVCWGQGRQALLLEFPLCTA